MIVVSGSNGIRLATYIAKKLSIPLVKAQRKTFEDQELQVQINADLHSKQVIIVQSTAKPVNDNLIELLMLINASKRAGAKKITAVIPYFGYARQDHSNDAREPIAANLVAKLLETSGVDQVITLDLHSKKIEDFFNINIANLSSYEKFAPYISKMSDVIVVSPDEGGIDRAKIFSEALGTKLAIVKKIRNSANKSMAINIVGNVKNKHCIIIDDIVDSATTICNAADLLHIGGALSVIAFVTHPVLSKNSIKLIENSRIKKLYVTNSIVQNNLPAKIEAISVDDIFVEALKLLK